MPPVVGIVTAVVTALFAIYFSGGCGEPDILIDVSFREYKLDVVCDREGRCLGANGEGEATGRDVRCQGVMSRQASRFSPHGIYLFWDYSIGSAHAEVELDFPTNVTGDLPTVATLREFEGGTQTFASDASRGIVNLKYDAGGKPQSGTFEVMFIDFGEDDKEGTADDKTRFLRFGTFSWWGVGEPACCVEPFYDEEYRVYWESGVRLEVWAYEESRDEYYYDDSGAEESEWDTYDDDSGDGCEGDTYDDGGSAEGCEGDTYDDGSSTEGCEGDTYDDSGGGCDCEGDVYGKRERGGSAEGSSWAGLMPLVVPFVIRRLLGKGKASK